MVVKDINKPEINFRLLVEEQKVGNIIYKISDSYAPEIGSVGKRISITTIDENKINDYGIIHGLDLSYGIIRSYYLIEDRNKSTHGGKYLEDPMEYYNEVIESFDTFVNSDNSEFISKALEVFNEFKNVLITIGSGKNAI